MRIDKFLKVSRLIKRRTVANEACDAGRILVNDKVVKASYDVKEGDIIEIRFGQKAVKAEVLSIAETTKKDEAKELFCFAEGPVSVSKTLALPSRSARMYLELFFGRVAFGILSVKKAPTSADHSVGLRWFC